MENYEPGNNVKLDIFNVFCKGTAILEMWNLKEEVYYHVQQGSRNSVGAIEQIAQSKFLLPCGTWWYTSSFKFHISKIAVPYKIHWKYPILHYFQVHNCPQLIILAIYLSFPPDCWVKYMQLCVFVNFDLCWLTLLGNIHT